ncbi:MAG TPA: hypothetical protein GX715_04375 [Armatimonadetes bacterium]|nr:hypothetical protein [Armatimonadota bacterium]
MTALLLTLPLLGAGCSGSGEDETASPSPDAMGMPEPGGPSPGMGGPPGDPGMAGPGDPGMAGPGDPGMGVPGAAAPAGGGTPSEEAISFTQMPFVTRPKRVMVRQPGGKPVEHVEFRYHAKGDPEALLAFLNPSPSASPDEGSTWFVRMPHTATAGKKTPGEWENLFCTYVVPDKEAIECARRALQARLTQLRNQVYRQKIYTVDLLAGDKLPQTAQVNAMDTAASYVPDPSARLSLYMDLTQRALDARQVDQAKLYLAAAGAAFADLSYENGRHGDALWMYQEMPRRAK